MTHILIVDDEPNIASALALLLQRVGYSTDTASDGQTALSLLEHSDDYDLVLLDLNLGDPLINGLVVCREIRSRPRYLPVIMLTVYGSSQRRHPFQHFSLRRPSP